MLLVHLPKENIMWVTDLVRGRPSSGPINALFARGRLYPPDAEKRTLDLRTPVEAI
jgi:hypothetical protein